MSTGIFLKEFDIKPNECDRCLFKGYDRCILTDDYVGIDGDYVSHKCPIVELTKPTIIYEDGDTEDLILCPDCIHCVESGGHANCNGYLYCKMQRTMKDEGDYCSRAERRW